MGMKIKKAKIKDLDVVIKMKMEMFIEVGSISLLQDNAEKKIYEKYKERKNSAARISRRSNRSMASVCDSV